MLATRTQLWPTIRILFMAALAIFVITVVIGILNGTDLYDPEHDTLITHVHSGTLGWLTLAITGGALWMFTEGRRLSDQEVRTGNNVGMAMLFTIALYVVAFWVGFKVADGILRPIAGTLVFLAVVWMLIWLFRQNATSPTTVPRLALLLAWVSITIGAVLGVLLGLFTARGELPGLSTEQASNLSEAHPPTMIVGYLILAVAGIVEWRLRDQQRLTSEDRAGVTQVWLFFLAGLVLILAVIIGSDEAIQALGGVNILFEIAAIAILLVRLRGELAPSAWTEEGGGLFARFSVVFLVVSIGLFVYLIGSVISGRYADFEDIPLGEILAADHSLFIGTLTLALFGMISAGTGEATSTAHRLIVWGVVVGVAGFAIGLFTDTTVLKRVFVPLMGVALLLGVVVFFMQLYGMKEPAEVEVRT